MQLADIDCNDEALDATMAWTSHNTDDRFIHLDGLMDQVQLDKCSLQGILGTQKTYGAMIGPNISILNRLTDTMLQITSQKEKQEMPKLMQQETSAPEAQYCLKEQEMPASRAQSNLMQTEISESNAKAYPMLLIIGGQDKEVVCRVCWALDQSKKFIEFCTIPFDVLTREHSVCLTDVGFVITGGLNSDLCVMFTAATQTWKKLKSLRKKRCYHGSVFIKGVIYVFGGERDGQENTTVEYLATEDEAWKARPVLLICVTFPKVANINDHAYLLDEATRQLLELDTKRNTWVHHAPLPGYGYCAEVSMAAVNGLLYAMGGRDRICAWYTPDTNTWCTGQQPERQHKYGSLVYYEDRLMLLGGSYMGGTDEKNNTMWRTMSGQLVMSRCLSL